MKEKKNWRNALVKYLKIKIIENTLCSYQNVMKNEVPFKIYMIKNITHIGTYIY